MNDTTSKPADGGPAFPFVEPSTEVNVATGMTLRVYAAIALRQPTSGIDWLDDMIRASMRDELAAKAVQGAFATPPIPCAASECEYIAMHAYRMFDAMLKARG
ncbi:hypothetical protein [Burkholderia glumae]